jgi:hypothetical protein
MTTVKDTMRSSERHYRFEFLSLPEELQERIVDALDAGEMTVREAEAEIRAAGHSLSFQGVASFYSALRRERRLLEINSGVKRLIEEFKNQPAEDRLRLLLDITLAAAIDDVASGNYKLKAIDVGELAGLIAAGVGQPPAPADPAAATVHAEKKPAGLTTEAAEELRRKILTGEIS